MNQPLRVRASRVRLGRDDYRVLRPARPPLRAFLYDDRRWALAMYADRAAVHVLATAWALATRSRHSLVYLPIRTNTPPDGLHDVPEPLDIVLMHHSAQFPASRWPAVRTRLGPGHLQTTRLPHDALPHEVNHERVRHRENRDHLRFDVAARTLFITGGPESFRREGAQLRPLLTDTPTDANHHHLCAEINAGRWGEVSGGTCAALLHVEYNDTWRL